MRTYGRNAAGQWEEITEDAYVYLATLIQNLRLIQNESPFYASAGIPAYNSVQTQIAPDIAVNNIQQQFSQYFQSLVITNTSTTNQPVYTANVVLPNGTVIQQVAS